MTDPYAIPMRWPGPIDGTTGGFIPIGDMTAMQLALANQGQHAPDSLFHPVGAAAGDALSGASDPLCLILLASGGERAGHLGERRRLIG